MSERASERGSHSGTQPAGMNRPDESKCTRLPAGSSAIPHDAVVEYDVMREACTALKAAYAAQFPQNVADPRHVEVLRKLQEVEARSWAIDPRDRVQIDELREEFVTELESLRHNHCISFCEDEANP